MHKATKEILGRRLGHHPDWAVLEHSDGCVEIIVKRDDGVELCSVCVNEVNRTFTAKKVPVTRMAQNYRIRDWREVLYIDAIETLKDSIGRLCINVNTADWLPCRPDEVPFELPKAVLARKSPAHLGETDCDLFMVRDYMKTENKRVASDFDCRLRTERIWQWIGVAIIALIVLIAMCLA